ncbi:MAG: type II secretion system F family protein [Planctomycetes bacterium]|nr:type II secretion system F family protein [Planctomycetota bacterium]
MANFNYTARDTAGREVVGAMQADSQAAVVRSLDEKKLFPVRVSQTREEQVLIGGPRRVKNRDIGQVYGQLADLLRAGVPLIRSMETISRATPNRRLAELVRSIRDDVAGGTTLADAMAARPAQFPGLQSAMVRAGERAGFLEDVLDNLAGFIEHHDDLRGKVIQALVYPLVLIGLGSVGFFLILILFVPTFKRLFGNMNLPAPTQFVFGMSDLVVNHYVIMLLGLAAIAAGIRMFMRSNYGAALWEKWKFSMPFVGNVGRMLAIGRFCRIFGTMLANGVPILQALSISKDASGSITMARCIEQAARNVQAGQSLAEPIKASGMFPLQIVEMISVAEESNQLEKVLIKIADTVEQRTERRLDMAVKLIEPAILVLIAGVYAFIMAGLMWPIFSLSEAIKSAK